jgi:acyl dehydratase
MRNLAIDYEKLRAREFPVVTHRYNQRDVMLYALSIGIGFDPVDERQIQFVYENGLQVFPTMAAILAYPGLWIREPDTDLDWEHALHSEQGMDFLRPLPLKASIQAQTRITGVVDKGEGRGALIYTERAGTDADSGEVYFKVYHTTFARRDGGYEGPSDPVRPPHAIPERGPDLICDLPTMPQQGLLYRLNGDPNPHNVDPKAAVSAGFERPVLHGLCTYGIAGHAVLRTCCDYDPHRLKSLHVRLSAPLYPGETVRTEFWHAGDSNRVSFRCRALDRDVIVLNNGHAVLAR